MKLYIGNRNYSSWSMRAGVLARQFALPVEEVKLRFDSFDEGSDFKRRISALTPTRTVPVLVDDDGFAVWDTLAIAETLAERHPQLALWPRDARSRARARSLCAEMHSGFRALRSHCPMNLEASLPEVGARLLAEHADLRADRARIEQAWSDALAGSGGPFLFGDFSIADAYFAPVCARIRTYGLPLPGSLAGYLERVFAAPGVAAWVADALAEHDFLQFEEPYRSAR